MNAYDKDNFMTAELSMEQVSDHFTLTKPNTKDYISKLVHFADPPYKAENNGMVEIPIK